MFVVMYALQGIQATSLSRAICFPKTCAIVLCACEYYFIDDNYVDTM